MRWALLLLALALPCFAQHPCDPKLTSQGDATDFKLHKGDRYRREPTFTFDVQADGRVTNIRLKRGSGIKRLDDLLLHEIESYRFNERPGCPVVEVTYTKTIHFD